MRESDTQEENQGQMRDVFSLCLVDVLNLCAGVSF